MLFDNSKVTTNFCDIEIILRLFATIHTALSFKTPWSVLSRPYFIGGPQNIQNTVANIG